MPDRELVDNVRRTSSILNSSLKDGYKHWIIAFSGGKDSSLLTSFVLESMRRGTLKPKRVDIVYSDTLMELPPFAENAGDLLAFAQETANKYNLPIHVQRVVSPVEHRFWFLVLGKGYPPPHNHFRWCTQRMKIWPAEKAIKAFADDASLVLTGVRWGESDARTGRLKAAMCSKDDSECGQGVWLKSETSMGIPSLAPIAHWRTCKVWDFLMFADAWWKWPFKSLNQLYGENGSTRFGCWTCTLVKEDKALASVIQHTKWSQFSVLSGIREKLLRDGRLPENRLLHPSGALGRTAIAFRKKLLSRVLRTQTRLGVPLISSEEVHAIKAYWATEERHGTPYCDECKFWRVNSQIA